LSQQGLWWWKLRARSGYRFARWLMRWPALVKQPGLWRWMEGQFSRMANLGDTRAQSFYGHLLLYRGEGLGARNEGQRLLQLAAQAGDGKAAYQLGVLCMRETPLLPVSAAQAEQWWIIAAASGHPLAARKLADLYCSGGPGLPADAAKAMQMDLRATELGL
jgi:hypothetical protein